MHLFLHLAQVEIKSTTSKNKFYRIQLIEAPPGQFDVWTRWGLIGEIGETALLGDKKKKKSFNSQAEAIKAFEEKFNDKTKNKWADRSKFVLKNDAYDMLEMDLGAIVAPVAVNAVGVKTGPCTLDKVTQSLVEPTVKVLTSTAPTAMAAPSAAAAFSGPHPLDSHYSRTISLPVLLQLSGYANAKVVEDYDCMLNTVHHAHIYSILYNILHLFLHHAQFGCWGSGCGLFYRIQLIEAPPGQFDMFRRWGRVDTFGETTVDTLLGYHTSKAEAIKAFERIFKYKTKNEWADRSKFVPKDDTYDMMEMDPSTMSWRPRLSEATAFNDKMELDLSTMSWRVRLGAH